LAFFDFVGKFSYDRRPRLGVVNFVCLVSLGFRRIRQ
jgi:hypothetical protein